MSSLGRVLAVIVGLLCAFNTAWALALPPAAHPPSRPAVAAWAVILVVHGSLYWYGDHLRGRFGPLSYGASQTGTLFVLGAIGAPFGLTLSLFVGLTAEMTILLRGAWSAVAVTVASIAAFSIASMIGSTLYQGAGAGAALAAVGIIAHSSAALLRRQPLQQPQPPNAGNAAAIPILLASSDLSASACSTLTDRETEVARILVTGARTADIARSLSISERTVKTHLSRIYQKLDVRSRSEAIAALLDGGAGGTIT